MGRVITLLKKIRQLNDKDLLDRFVHIVRAQAVREYAAMPREEDLLLEIRLINEEILKRTWKGADK